MKNHIISALLAIATLICIGCECKPNKTDRELTDVSMTLGKKIYELALLQSIRENNKDYDYVQCLFEKKKDSILNKVYTKK